MHILSDVDESALHPNNQPASYYDTEWAHLGQTFCWPKDFRYPDSRFGPSPARVEEPDDFYFWLVYPRMAGNFIIDMVTL